MKKLSPDQYKYFLILRDQKLRSQRKRRIFGPQTKKIRNAPVKVIAPQTLDIYSPVNHRKTTDFLAHLREQMKNGKRVIVCFRNTTLITAAAGLLTLAEIERLVEKFGRHRISAAKPAHKRGKYGDLDRTVEAVLEQIGVFKALGMQSANIANGRPMVDCWRVESGKVADGSTAGKMLRAIHDRIPAQSRKLLYRGAIEALSNCVEHAYIGLRQDGLCLDDRRWWMFTAQINKKLVVLVCDLGVGIPNTIRTTQSPSLLDQIFSTFGFQPGGDGAWIKAATLVKETRTGASHRGKGGGDLRELIRVDNTATLTIFSNKGYYKHATLVSKFGSQNDRGDFHKDRKNSILGTIVEWTTEVV